MAFLGIDTSNYATSLAVVNEAKEVVCAKKEFLPVKPGELGLRQSDALFQHTLALPAMLQALANQGVLENIRAVGVSSRPRPISGSYMPCFLAGLSVATAFATALNVPLIQTSHQQGHVAAALHGTNNPELSLSPAMVLHISGGTTEILHTCKYEILDRMGGSLDLFAGQAIDRLGVQLGLPFPAGEAVSALASQCTINSIKPKISVKNLDCHFSGLQNQFERMLAEGKAPQYVAKYCLFAIADTLITMLRNARSIYPSLPIICAGGVMGSNVIRPRMEQQLDNIYFVDPEFSSDNAIGVALIAQSEVVHGGDN